MKIIENDETGIYIEENGFSISYYKGELYTDYPGGDLCFSEEVARKIFESMLIYYRREL